MVRMGKLGLGLSLAALAATGVMAATVGQVIDARQKGYKEIGKSMKAIADELKNSAPSTAVINANAKVIANLAPKVAGWFPKGTGPQAGVKTHAKAEIWQKPADFKKDQADLVVAARQLVTVSATGNLDATKAAVGGLGKTCKACHDSFRAKDD